MRVAITSYKGGVGKTTTALNLAGAMAEITGARVLLVDGDPNRSAIRWRDRGDGLPFTVCAEKQAPRYWPEADHVVIDTAARPSVDDLRDLLEIVDFVLIATTPDTLALDTLRPAIDTLSTAGGATRYRVMISMIPPIGRAGAEARDLVERAQWPIVAGGLRRYAAHTRAAAQGCLVRDAGGERAAEAWSDAIELAKEIMR